MLLLTVLFALVQWTQSLVCPPYLQRFSQDPTICKPTNSTCSFIRRGLDGPKEIALILKLHNAYRSRVAMGEEHLAGGMPKAANMMQMEWDSELAAVAQKWAENCVYQHDCHGCRQVENFPVGQNIAYKDFWCPEIYCTPDKSEEIPAWTEIIKIFYDEIVDFDHEDVDHFKSIPTKMIGHFTQMIWANTWRLGCGYTVFSYGNGKRHFFVCNYGPTGNTIDWPIYRKGAPCSGCPSNSCCGDHCQGKVKYPGLCKMLDRDTAPIYPQKANGLIFSCGFEPGNKNCKVSATGITNWITKSTLSGNIQSIRLHGGQSSHLQFATVIRPAGKFCLRIQFRKGPTVAGRYDTSLLSITFDQGNGSSFTLNLDLTSNDFSPYSIDLSQIKETRFTINFSVPSGEYSHILDIKDIVAFPGECNSREIDGLLGFQA